jgi:hypothetical protein
MVKDTIAITHYRRNAKAHMSIDYIYVDTMPMQYHKVLRYIVV